MNRLHVSAPEKSAERAFANADIEIDLFGLLRTLWLGKWLILLASLIGIGVSIWYLTALAIPTYRATAVVALDSREAQVVDIESVVSGLSGDQASINTEVEVLRSRELLGAVADKLELIEDPEFNETLDEPSPFSPGEVIRFVAGLVTGQPHDRRVFSVEQQRDKVIDVLGESLSINNVRQSYVFRITATAKDPDLSRELANVVADFYLQSQLEAKFEATQRATKWLTDRVAELQIALEAAEQAVKNFSVTTDLVGPDVLEAQERQVKDLRDRVLDMTVRVEVARKRLADLTAAAEDLPQLLDLTDDPTLRRLLQIDATTDNPAVIARTQQIVDRSNVELTRSENQLRVLQVSLLELEDSNSEQAQDLVQLRQLQREAEASGLIYEYFLSRLKETSVQQGIQQPDARILSFATTPLDKASPRTVRNLAGFAVLGAVLASILVVVREVTQSTFRTAEMLEGETGYDVIGQTPVIPVKKRESLIEYLHSKPTSAAAEAIRNLRTTLLLQDIDNPPKVIVSTSTVPSEGKTTQSVGLAINLALMGRRVLLIEGDIRRRVFGNYFSIPGTRGIVSVLGGQVSFDEAVHHADAYGIDVLQGEASQVNAADLYSSRKFKEFLDERREAYEFVIIDTPPVLAVPDARIVAQVSDAVIYSVKWDDTPKAMVRRGLRQFESVGIRISGLVLSQVDPKGIKGYGYGDYGNAEYYET